MIDDHSVEFHILGFTGWDSEGAPRQVIDLRYVRVEDPDRYPTPTEDSIAFVWEEWLVLDRIEKYGRRPIE